MQRRGQFRPRPPPPPLLAAACWPTAAPAALAEDFLRPHLLKLKAYTPIEPFEILAQRLGCDAKDIVKLDANENPYGPPPEVPAALGSMPFPNIYPDPESRRLREALAAWHGVPAEHLLVRGWRLGSSGRALCCVACCRCCAGCGWQPTASAAATAFHPGRLRRG